MKKNATVLSTDRSIDILSLEMRFQEVFKTGYQDYRSAFGLGKF